MDWRTAYSLRFSGMAPAQRAFLQGGRLEALAYWRAPDAEADTPLKKLMAIDNANYLPEYVPRKSDLCTMAHGLEARAPFLDHRFVQRLLAEPEESVYTSRRSFCRPRSTRACPLIFCLGRSAASTRRWRAGCARSLRALRRSGSGCKA